MCFEQPKGEKSHLGVNGKGALEACVWLARVAKRKGGPRAAEVYAKDAKGGKENTTEDSYRKHAKGWWSYKGEIDLITSAPKKQQKQEKTQKGTKKSPGPLNPAPLAFLSALKTP